MRGPHATQLLDDTFLLLSARRYRKLYGWMMDHHVPKNARKNDGERSNTRTHLGREPRPHLLEPLVLTNTGKRKKNICVGEKSLYDQKNKTFRVMSEIVPAASAPSRPARFLDWCTPQVADWHKGRLKGNMLERWKQIKTPSGLPDLSRQERRAVAFLRFVHMQTPGSLKTFLMTVKANKATCDYLCSDFIRPYVFESGVGTHNLFLRACQEDHPEFVEWLLANFRDELLVWAASSCRPEPPKYEWGDFPPARLEEGATCTKGERCFQVACEFGRLSLVQYLWTELRPLDVHASHNLAFWNACSRSDKSVGEWLFATFPFRQGQVHAGQDYGFRVLCGKGDLAMLQWLLQSFPGIDVHALRDEGFRLACQHGRLDTAQWLLEKHPDIDAHAVHEYAFRAACHMGHLAVAQWLWSQVKGIDLQAEDGHAFQGGHAYVNEWLAEISPSVRRRHATGWCCWK